MNRETEYGALIQKMGSNEAWAYSFVAIYFAFMASLGGILGFLIGNESAVAETVNSGGSIGSFGLSDAICLCLIALTIWAAGMVVDYKCSTKRLMLRMAYLEKELGWSDDGPLPCAQSYLSAETKVWRYGTYVVVGSVMALFFSPWLLSLLA